MNEHPGFFEVALVYLAAAVISVPLAKRVGLGSVLGYLAAGVAIGPFALGLVGGDGQAGDLMHVAEFGVVVMLFLIGLELNLPALWRMRGSLLGLGGLQVLASGLALAGAALGWGLDWRQALAIGFILSLSSTAIVLQSLREKSLHGTAGGRHAFATLLFQDIAVIPLLALLPLLAAKDLADRAATSSLDRLPAWLQGLAVLGAVSGVVVLGRWLVPHVFGYIARSGLREIFTAAALLLVIGLATLMTQVGLSPALGAFLGGVVLAGSPYRHELEGDLEPFKGILLGLFFVSIGASMDLHLVMTNPWLIALLVAGLVLIKGAVLAALSKVFRFGADSGTLYTLSLFQAGEFAFVLLGQARALDVLAPETVATLNAVVAMSMALTPLALLIYHHLLQPRLQAAAKAGTRPADVVVHRSPVILVGFGRFGNYVGRLLRSQGIRPVILETDAEHVELTRRLGFEVHYGDATRLELLHAAGAAEAKLMIIAVDDEETIDRLVAMAARHFPQLELVVRATGMEHRMRLLNAGVQHVFHELAGSALDAGARALRLLGLPAYTAERAARRFSRHDLETAGELAAVRHDESAYVAMVRERVAALESLFRTDPIHPDGLDDHAWDRLPHKRGEARTERES
jgi:CPA2 family monovalent cation:H+ antiporter-2/glutathione-regulated potassium-efflux system protein KefB